MPKTLLIHTIGNRDLQFTNQLPAKYVNGYELEFNKEGMGEYYVIPQRSKNSYFRSICQDVIMDLGGLHASHILDCMRMPMLEAVCQYIYKKENTLIDRVLLCFTAQPEPFRTDTDKIGEIIENYLEDKLSTRLPQVAEFSYKYMALRLDPEVEKYSIFQYINREVMQTSIQGFDRVFVSPRQGHPDITFAFQICGLFQGFSYLRLGKDGVAVDSLAPYEEIIRQIIQLPS